MKRLAVKVAEDVLKQVEEGKIIPTNMVYVTGRRGELPKCMQVVGDLQNILKTKHPTCRACGIGAAFLALVGLRNQFDLYGAETGLDRYEVSERLEEAFTLEEINDIENAFEGGLEDQLNRKISAKKCLTLIMQDIIKNKGQFKLYNSIY